MPDQTTERAGFLFDVSLEDLDPATVGLTRVEERRQVDKLIMIASESAAPAPVREMLASVFTDLYAEGYPAAHTTHEPEALIADVPYQIAYHERFGDRRYYKGTELADLVEALAQERIRELFAPNRYAQNSTQLGPDQIQANVQPLSGANANTAVYLALLQPGDTILGMNLSEGGHLSHGSPVNISGKLFKVIPYGVDLATGRIDYDQVARLAREHNPRMIVTGASAYPWAIDFSRVRQICDSLPRKAYLLADVSHPAGLVAAGLFPNPIGVADVTTFTTHKTLIGPRAAVILTTSETLARRIDRAVFPGLQGGPHMNTIAAMAVAFKIGLTPQFDELQRQIVRNAKALAETLANRGLTLAYGGTETHLLLIDLKPLEKPSGVPLNGDVAARILDLAGIVCNKNTIAGDVSATHPTGIRLGTPWITQRGLTEDDMRAVGGVIADLLQGIVTFSYFGDDEAAHRGKVPVEVLKQAQATVADLTRRRAVGPARPEPRRPEAPYTLDGNPLIEVYSRRVRAFLDEATDADVWSLEPGQASAATLRDPNGQAISPLAILRRSPDQYGFDHFMCAAPADRANEVTWWLEALSSGMVLFDPADPRAKVDGPVAVAQKLSPLSDAEADALTSALAAGPGEAKLNKPYFVGQRALVDSVEIPPRPECALPQIVDKVVSPIDPEAGGARDGWTMPRSYGDPVAELKALRETVGLIDESGLGVCEVAGRDAGRFLDLATTSDVAFLARNAAQNTFLLDARGQVIADVLLYRVGDDRYLLTTPPSRSAQVRAWLEEARSGRCVVDPDVPTRALPTDLTIRDLRQLDDSTARAVLGLAGPNAAATLRALADTPEDRRKVGRLRRFTLVAAKLGGQIAIVARTGHTGPQAYEIFVHPSGARALWDAARAKGAEQRIAPVGWDAWRSAGLATGLPWLGSDVDQALRVSPIEAGFGAEVQAHKPFFIGRGSLLREPFPPERLVTRFKVADASGPSPQDGDPLLDQSGVCVGRVTGGPPLAAEPVGLALVTRDFAAVGTPLRALVGFARSHTAELGEPIAPGLQGFPVAAVEMLTRVPK